jgi:PTH1 family peptidyl-tRNA hydrolase
VLGHPSGDDRKILDEAEELAAEAAVAIMDDGADAAMNRFNGKKE